MFDEIYERSIIYITTYFDSQTVKVIYRSKIMVNIRENENCWFGFFLKKTLFGKLFLCT